MDISKPLFEADTCIEFLILSFCHHFQANPKQAAGLLSQKNKFLGQLVMKGLRGDHEPVISWLQDIYANTERLTGLLAKERASLDFVLNALKTGYISKEAEVVEWTLRVTSKLFLDLAELDLLDSTWEWFVEGPHSPLKLSINAVQKFGNRLIPFTAELYSQTGHFTDLFISHLPKLLNNDYFYKMSEFLPHFAESEVISEELLTAGVLTYWAEQTSREALRNITALHFLVQLCTLFYDKLHQSVFNNTISLLNRLCREDQEVVKHESTCVMFFLLDFFIEKSSFFAGVVYRALTFLLVESFGNSFVREYVQKNFILTLKRFPSIPVGILMEPLLKRLKIAEIELETFDMDFFWTIAQHPTLQVSHAVLLADYMGKVYLTDLIMSRSCGVVITCLASRFANEIEVQKYLFMFCKYSLGLALQTELFSVDYKFRTRNFSEDETYMISDLLSQKFLIFNLASWVIQQWDSYLNDKLHSAIVTLNQSYKETMKENLPSFVELLELIGKRSPAVPKAIHSPRYTTEIHDEEESRESQENFQERISRNLKKKYKENSQEIVEEKPKRSEFPWARAFGDIIRAKEKFQEKQDRVREEAERKVKEFEAQQRKVQKQLDIRKVEQGRSREEATVSFFKEGLASKYVAIEEVDLKDSSNDELVKILLKKYSRVFLVWFQKYSGTGFERKKQSPSDFDWLASRKEKINEAEFIRLLSDHSVIPKLLSKEELKMLMKNFCLKVLKQPEQYYVQYTAFKELFCQIAWFVYAKPKHDYSHLPPVFAVQALLHYMRDFLNSRNFNTELFDEPDPGTGDKEVIKKLNALLREDPSTPIPPGYLRVADFEFQLQYFLPDFVGIPENFVFGYESLDYILNQALGIRLLEPQVLTTQFYRAKGAKNRINSAVYKSSPGMSTVKLSGQLKSSVARSNDRDKYVLEECAIVLENLVNSITLNLNRVASRSAKMHGEQRVEAKKAQERAILQRQKEIDRQKMAKRQVELHAMIAKAKEERQEMLRRESERRREVEAKQRSRSKLRAEKAKLEQELKKKSIEEYLSQKLKERQYKKAESKRSVSEDFKNKQTNIKHHIIPTQKTKDLLKLQKQNIDEVFSYYCKQSKNNYESTLLNYESFKKFCFEFKIAPHLVSDDQTRKVFNAVISKRPGSLTLSRSDFEECLISLSEEALVKLHSSNNDSSRSFSSQTVSYMLKYLDIEKPHQKLAAIKRDAFAIRSSTKEGIGHQEDQMKINSNR